MSEPPRIVRIEEIMGTVVGVHVVLDAPADAPAVIDSAIDACLADLRAADALFSPYRADSEVSRIGRGELDLDLADARVREVAAACAIAETATEGRFSAHWRGVFDPTGYVKGGAVERAATAHLWPLLDHPGVLAAAINAGGDLQVRTAREADWSWGIGIADPRHPDTVLARLELRDGAVATSGTAERGAHVLDPRSGLPATGAVSATVVSDGLAHADLWATAALVAGIDDLSWLERAATRSGILVGDDSRVRRWLGATEVSIVGDGALLGGL